MLDVYLAIMKDNAPLLVANRDTMVTGLWPRHQTSGKITIHRREAEKFGIRKLFLFYRWYTGTMPSALYNEEDLHRKHRGFGNPSVGAAHGRLKKANKDKLEIGIKIGLKKIPDG